MKCSIPSEFVSTSGTQLEKKLKGHLQHVEITWMLTGVYQVVRMFPSLYFNTSMGTVEWFIISKGSFLSPELEPELSTLPVTQHVNSVSNLGLYVLYYVSMPLVTLELVALITTMGISLARGPLALVELKQMFGTLRYLLGWASIWISQ